MKRGLSIFAALCGSLAVPLAATQQDLAAPGVGARFLNVPSSAVSLAQASALGAVSGGLESLGINPAGLAGLDTPQLGFTHSLLIEDASLEHVVAGMGLERGGAVALGVDYLNYGSVDSYRVDAGGQLSKGEVLHPSALALNLVWARFLVRGVSLGAAMKTVTENLGGGSSTGLALDLGLQWHPGLGGLGFGFSLIDFGGGLQGEQLPSQARLSTAYEFGPALALPLRISADGLFNVADRGSAQAFMAAEIRPLPFAALRAGYNLAGTDGPTGLALGAGLHRGWLALDYAYAFAGDLGPTQRFSLSVALPRSAPKPEAEPAEAAAAPVAAEASAGSGDRVDSLLVSLQTGDEAALRQSAVAIVAAGPEAVQAATQAVSSQELQPAVFNGELAKAENAARVLTEIDPHNARAYIALGVLRWHQGDAQACLKYLHRAYELDPSRGYLAKMIKSVGPASKSQRNFKP